jgi:hypothetical protein
MMSDKNLNSQNTKKTNNSLNKEKANEILKAIKKDGENK